MIVDDVCRYDDTMMTMMILKTMMVATARPKSWCRFRLVCHVHSYRPSDWPLAIQLWAHLWMSGRSLDLDVFYKTYEFRSRSWHNWMYFSSYDMSIFGEFPLASWKSSLWKRLEAMELEATPRLEAKSENTTLALDRAIAGFLVRSSFNISYLVPWKRWIHWKFHMILCGVMAFLMAMVIPTVVSMVILGRQYSFVDVWNRTSWIFLTSVCQATKVK